LTGNVPEQQKAGLCAGLLKIHGDTFVVQLLKALHLAKVTGATLVIAKLDRLSRNATFLLTLRDSGVRFIAADMPDANDITVGIMALVAQHNISPYHGGPSSRQGPWGASGPNGAAALKRADKGNAAGVAAIRVAADSHAKNLQPVINYLASEGMTSLGAVAEALNERGMLTPRGGRWHKSSVRNLLNRLGNPTAHE
jgi:hypothetical protein